MPIGQQAVQPQMTAQQANAIARAYVLQNAVNDIQQIFSQTLTGTIPAQVVNVLVKPVGLIKRFIVQVSYTYIQSAAETQTLTTLGTSNIFSQVVLTDLSNQTRVNTTGWHLQAVASQKRGWPFGSSIGTNAAAATDCPFGYGTNFQNVQTAPSSVTNVSKTIYAMFEVPVTYSDTDLRGGIYAGVTQATMNLQLTVNPNINIASTGNANQAVYKSTTTDKGTIGAFTITVYQNFLDQIPSDKNGNIVLPSLDISTAYLLQNTQVGSLVQTADNPIPYAPYRDFLGTTLMYDNNGTLTQGTDINSFALTAANYTNLWKYTPAFAALLSRLKLQIDMPTGCYWFDHRDKPISTVNYGNMQLTINPSTVASCTANIGYEMLAIINQVTNASSLYGT